MIERVLIYDPVPCKDGSKKVMKKIITKLPRTIDVWVISNDKDFWCDDCHDNVHFMPLFSPRYLQSKTSGVLYFIKHFVYLFSLFSHMMRLKRFTKIIGFSGPCIDFSLYLLTEIIQIDIIQLIQDDVTQSKISTFGLTRAKRVFYLQSTRTSIIRALQLHNDNELMSLNKFIAFTNGIDCSTIQTQNISLKNKDKNNEKVGFLWSASFLKWQRLEFFIDAINKLNSNPELINKYFASVYYIDRKNEDDIDINRTDLDKVDNIHWYVDPKNLNDIRASSSVFISTSEKEPFGLSILESMAAGLAIVIPADNAYWDQHLTDGYDCVKYDPNDMESLVQALTRLINDRYFLLKTAQQAKHSVQKYCHRHCYDHILKYIPN